MLFGFILDFSTESTSTTTRTFTVAKLSKRKSLRCCTSRKSKANSTTSQCRWSIITDTMDPFPRHFTSIRTGLVCCCRTGFRNGKTYTLVIGPDSVILDMKAIFILLLLIVSTLLLSYFVVKKFILRSSSIPFVISSHYNSRSDSATLSSYDNLNGKLSSYGLIERPH